MVKQPVIFCLLHLHLPDQLAGLLDKAGHPDGVLDTVHLVKHLASSLAPSGTEGGEPADGGGGVGLDYGADGQAVLLV